MSLTGCPRRADRVMHQKLHTPAYRQGGIRPARGWAYDGWQRPVKATRVTSRLAILSKRTMAPGKDKAVIKKSAEAPNRQRQCAWHKNPPKRQPSVERRQIFGKAVVAAKKLCSAKPTSAEGLPLTRMMIFPSQSFAAAEAGRSV